MASAPLTGVITGVFSSTTQLSGRPEGLEYSDAGLEKGNVYNIILLNLSEHICNVKLVQKILKTNNFLISISNSVFPSFI